LDIQNDFSSSKGQVGVPQLVGGQRGGRGVLMWFAMLC